MTVVPLHAATFPYKDAAALEAALDRLAVEIRYNVRGGRGEMRRDGGDWREMTDRSTADLRREIAATFEYKVAKGSAPLHFGQQSWDLWTNALFHHAEVDPFREWLEARPQWDGVRRIRQWLADVFDLEAEADPLAKWTASFIFLGPVERAYRPGAKLDEMPVLIGSQGCGKSTALRLALPPEHPAWFADGLHLAASPKERAEALLGRVIVEAAEMAGSTRAELESLKSFLSRTDDGSVRLAYRRNPETMLRRSVIVGTSNDPACLPNDATGLRRFVPVVIAGGDPAALRAYLAGNRDQLWAEAVTLHRDRKCARLPEDLAPRQRVATEAARRRDDILEDQLAVWLDGLAERDRPFTLAYAAQGVGLVHDVSAAPRLHMRDQRRLGAALTSAGYEKRREMSAGRRRYVWVRT
ncbi:VapE domain-containing protein [Candidatus Palauibacter sp.]|uniref:VapE domain-containing protein n=1 Tax=Candidatus Palauibacter sp. TaxID=3101350 RepID=UPI003AF201B6